MISVLASPPDWLCAISVLRHSPDVLRAIIMLGLPPAVLRVMMVLPVRIELTTSALPRMRSTTELRQHVGRKRRAYDGGRLALSTLNGAGGRVI